MKKSKDKRSYEQVTIRALIYTHLHNIKARDVMPLFYTNQTFDKDLLIERQEDQQWVF